MTSKYNREQNTLTLLDGKELNCSPSCRDIWGDGVAVVEGKDYRLVGKDCKEEDCLCGYATDEAALCPSRIAHAFPLTGQSEEEMWREVIKICHEEYDITIGGIYEPIAIERFKELFTIKNK